MKIVSLYFLPLSPFFFFVPISILDLRVCLSPVSLEAAAAASSGFTLQSYRPAVGRKETKVSKKIDIKPGLISLGRRRGRHLSRLCSRRLVSAYYTTHLPRELAYFQVPFSAAVVERSRLGMKGRKNNSRPQPQQRGGGGGKSEMCTREERRSFSCLIEGAKLMASRNAPVSYRWLLVVVDCPVLGYSCHGRVLVLLCGRSGCRCRRRRCHAPAPGMVTPGGSPTPAPAAAMMMGLGHEERVGCWTPQLEALEDMLLCVCMRSFVSGDRDD